MIKSTNKAQAIALNTIVIAILVIIVLLVIIVFFTSQVGDTGDQLEQNNPGSCSLENPAIAALGYEHAEYSTHPSNYEEQCNSQDYQVVSVIPKNSKTFTYNGKEFQEGAVCCATKDEKYS